MAKKHSLEAEALDARYERYKEILKDLTIMSDIFMRNVFKKKKCMEYVLQVILGKKDLKLIDNVIQKDYKNLQGRSAVLDCVAKDSEGNLFDAEIQQENEGASPKRARYHSGLLDMNTLNPGQDFDELPESYVIFITRNDVLGRGLPIYHVDRRILELDESFPDNVHIIYVNSKKQEDIELGRLMHDFHCKNAKDIHSQILAERVYELKETPKGVEHMCREMEMLYNEGIEIGEKIGEKRGEKRGRKIGEKHGFKKGKLDHAKETALSMAKDGISIEKIAYYVNVTTEKVQKWLNENLNNVH